MEKIAEIHLQSIALLWDGSARSAFTANYFYIELIWELKDYSRNFLVCNYSFRATKSRRLPFGSVSEVSA
ncbi:MAG: hypothetical protein ABIR06_22520 [Cyclobacteriaceae bacterium]